MSIPQFFWLSATLGLTIVINVVAIISPHGHPGVWGGVLIGAWGVAFASAVFYLALQIKRDIR